jgi:hypothetical protein
MVYAWLLQLGTSEFLLFSRHVSGWVDEGISISVIHVSAPVSTDSCSRCVQRVQVSAGRSAWSTAL